MDTEKRIVLTFVLFFAFMLAYSQFLPKKKITPLTAVAMSQTKHEAEAKAPSILPSETPNIEKVVIGDLEIAYSRLGGYVQSVKSQIYGDSMLFGPILVTPEFQQENFDVSVSPSMITFLSAAKQVTKAISIDQGGRLTVTMRTPKETELIVFTQQHDTNRSAAQFQDAVVISAKKAHKIAEKDILQQTVFQGVSAGFRDRYYAAVALNLPKVYFSKDNGNKYVAIKTSDISFQSYVGPLKRSILKKAGVSELLDFGWLNPIAAVLSAILFFFFGIFHNWGLAIIALSLMVYGSCFPLTAQSTKAMKKMQDLQPKMEKMKEQHKDDPQAMQAAMVELYRKHKINPMSGCLPLLLQMPIFISLYQLLYRLVELKGAHFLWIKNLAAPDQAFTLPFTLPLVGNGIHALPIVMATATFFQQKLTTKPESMTEQQRMMIQIMPIMMLFIFYNFPAGLVIYWLTNTTLTTAYQLRLKSIPTE